MNLPRQARYKHRETLKKRCVLRRSLPARTSGGNVGDGFAQYSDGAKRFKREVVRQNENAAYKASFIHTRNRGHFTKTGSGQT